MANKPSQFVNYWKITCLWQADYINKILNVKITKNIPLIANR